jgi:predicted kinase
MAKVTLLRGISGAGKTRHAQTLTDGLCYFSTDDFWRVKDIPFDPLRLSEAHGWCFSKFVSRAIYTRDELVVDNTNISAWELAPYILAATAYGYEHEIMTIWADPIIAWRRNKHNVPAHVVLSMYQRLLKEELPTFWKHRVIYPEV